MAEAVSEIICWQCPICLTLMRIEEAIANRCCQQPRRDDCPLPHAGLAEIAAAETAMLALLEQSGDPSGDPPSEADAKS